MTNRKDQTTAQPSDRIRAAYQVFFDAMKTNNLQNILKAAYEFTGYPVNLTDEHYRLIYQYPQKKLGEFIWDTLYETKTLPPEVLEKWLNMYLVHTAQTDTYAPFYADWGLVENAPRIFAEVYRGKRIFGHLALFTSTEGLKKDDLEITQIIVDALQMHMYSAPINNLSLSTSLDDLLNINSNAELKRQAERILTQHLGNKYFLMVSPASGTPAKKAFSAYAAHYLLKEYHNIATTIHQNNIVVLFGKIDMTAEQLKHYHVLKEIASVSARMQIHSGISQAFRNLFQLPEKYQQALLTAQLTTDYIAYYDDLAPRQLYQFIAQSPTPEAFIHPLLKTLKRYDYDNKTAYFATLRTFCLEFFNKEATAKTLNIHRNTLSYRLERLEEMFDLDYRSPRIARYLLSSFEIWDAMEDRH